MSLQIPVLDTFLAAVWFGIGLTFGRGFGKNLDQTIQKTDWYKAPPGWQWLTARCLMLRIHWRMGALLMVYAAVPELFGFGAGFFVDDLPDVPRASERAFPEALIEN